MTPNRSNLSICILAGGKGARFGGPKHRIKIKGKSIIENQIEVFSNITPNIYVIAKPQYKLEYKNARILYEKTKSFAPVFGIIEGLKTIKTSWALFYACDMPFPNIQVVRSIFSSAGNTDLVIPLANGKLQMLYALYHKNLLEPIRKMVRNKNYKLNNLIFKVKTTIVSMSNPNAFFNINTKDDLESI